MKEIELNVTVDEANLILESLGEQPFVKVFDLVAKLQQQARSQLGRDDAPALASTGPEATPDFEPSGVPGGANGD